MYNGPTYFVGNGLLKLNRQDIFTVAVPKYKTYIEFNLHFPMFNNLY